MLLLGQRASLHVFGWLDISDFRLQICAVVCLAFRVCVAMQVKENQLQELLLPAGFVWELTIPRKPDGAPSSGQHDKAHVTLGAGAPIFNRKIVYFCRAVAGLRLCGVHVPSARRESHHIGKWPGVLLCHSACFYCACSVVGNLTTSSAACRCWAAVP